MPDNSKPPDMKFFGPEELAQYLVMKDWREVLYILPGKDDNGRPTPVARFMGGKFVLFPYEYHSSIKVGDCWECRIIEDNPKYMKAMPIRKITSIKIDKDAMPPLPPDLAGVFVEAVEAKMAALEPELKRLQEEEATLEKKEAELEEEIEVVQAKLSDLHDRIQETATIMTHYKKALGQYGPQRESSQDMGDYQSDGG